MMMMPEIREEDGIKVLRPISSGSYGTVYLMTDGSASKRFIPDASEEEEEEKESDGLLGLPRDGVREIAMLVGLRSRHVVSALGVIVDSEGQLWCTMQFASHGSLGSFLRKTPRERVLELSRNITIQLFEALAYVHSRNVVHRDVKPENVLVFDEGRRVVLSDFGSALVCASACSRRDAPARSPGDVVTTLWYRAPEILFGMYDADSPAMDVWAAGLITHEVCTCSQPLFCRVKSEAEMIPRMCSIFGTPTRANDLMPSYSAHSRGAMPCPLQCKRTPPPQSDASLQPWLKRVLGSSLVLEPSRRSSALACAEMARPEDYMDVDLDYECPKTPMLSLPLPDQEPDKMLLQMRMVLGHAMFETFLGKAAYSYASRRAFHVAARLLDRLCIAGEITEQRGPCTCAAVCSIASKVCDLRGINPTWSSLLRNGGCRVGIAKFVLDSGSVCTEEVRVLNLLRWNAWDVTLLDVDRPGGTVKEAYDYVIDMIAASMCTSNYVPSEVTQIASIVSDVIADNTSVGKRYLPMHLDKLLKACVTIVNNLVSTSTMLRRTHAKWSSSTLNGERIDFEHIKVGKEELEKHVMQYY